MKKRTDNKGFSLVELIIVISIMAVLIGILAPVYLQYVDRTKRTTDCAGIGAVLDACEVLAGDPDVFWNVGDAIVIDISTNQSGSMTQYTGDGPVSSLKELVPEKETCLTASWGPFQITATKNGDGEIQFDMDDSDIAELANYSTTLSSRLE